MAMKMAERLVYLFYSTLVTSIAMRGFLKDFLNNV